MPTRLQIINSIYPGFEPYMDELKKGGGLKEFMDTSGIQLISHYLGAEEQHSSAIAIAILLGMFIAQEEAKKSNG